MTVGTLGNTHSLNILSGGAVTGEVVNVTPDRNNNRLWAWNAGEFVITGEVVANGVINNREIVSGWENNSVGKFEKITIDGNAASKYFSFGNAFKGATHQFWIGDGGLNFKTSSTLARYGTGFASGDVVYLHPWHDGFEIGKKGDQGRFRFRASGNSVLDTDNEAGEGKGIVFNVICESDNATSPVVIAGSGYVRYNAVNTHSGTVTVNSGAKLELGAGAKSGTGALTVKSGATLSAIEPGSAATIGDACTLESGSTLEFAISGASNSSFAFTTAPTGSATVKFAPGFNSNPGSKFTLATGVGVADECKFTLDPKYGGTLEVDKVNGTLVYKARDYFYIRITENGEPDDGFDINPAWFLEHGGIVNGELSEDAVKSTAPNGMSYLASYLMGYEPLDPDSNFKLTGASGDKAGKFKAAATFNIPGHSPKNEGMYKAEAVLLGSDDGVTFSPVDGVDTVGLTPGGGDQVAEFSFTPVLGDREMRFFA